MPRHRQPGSSRWIAERLREQGVDVSHNTIAENPHRVIWEDGEPVTFASRGWQNPDETRAQLIERMYRRGVLTGEQAAALLREQDER